MIIRWGRGQFATAFGAALGVFTFALDGWSAPEPLSVENEPWVRSSVGSSISDSWRTLPPPGASESEPTRSVRFSLSAGMESFPYSSNMYGENQWGSFSTSFHGGLYDGPFIAHADGAAGTTTQRGNPVWVEFRELYVGTTPLVLRQSQLHLGRQWVQWSRLDEEFNLGLTQPRFRWNPLKPTSVGLVGAFWNFDVAGFHMMVFGSFLSVPERSYGLEAKDGAITSSSPFFARPPSSTVFSGVNTPLYYSIAMPSLDQLLIGRSLGARVEVGDSREGPWSSIMYLNKPLNQIAMNFDYPLNVASAPPRIDMTLYPTRWMHHLGGFELGYSAGPLAGWAGGTLDLPYSQDARDAKWATQEFTNAATAAGGLEFRWPQGAMGGSRLGLAYLHTWGGNASDRANPAAPAGGSQFEFRYPLRDALQLRLRTGIRALKLEGEGKMTWDLNRGSLLGQVDLSFRPLRNWELLVGGTWIQTQNVTQALSPENPDSFASMADLDSVTAGVRYTF